MWGEGSTMRFLIGSCIAVEGLGRYGRIFLSGSSCAALFWIVCSFLISTSGIPNRRLLQVSSRESNEGMNELFCNSLWKNVPDLLIVRSWKYAGRHTDFTWASKLKVWSNMTPWLRADSRRVTVALPISMVETCRRARWLYLHSKRLSVFS